MAEGRSIDRIKKKKKGKGRKREKEREKRKKKSCHFDRDVDDYRDGTGVTSFSSDIGNKFSLAYKYTD